MAKRHLKRALYLGVPAETLEREQWLTLAQAGQMAEAQLHLTDLLQDSRGDGAEICEAFVVGYLKSRDFTAAFELLDAWTLDYPRDAQPHYWRGLTYLEFLDLVAAEASLRRAVELRPTHADAAYWLADLLLDGGRVEEAVVFYEHVSRLRPLDADASVGHATCLRRLGRPAEAVAILKQVLAKGPNDKALVEWAHIDIESGSVWLFWTMNRVRP